MERLPEMNADRRTAKPGLSRWSVAGIGSRAVPHGSARRCRSGRARTASFVAAALAATALVIGGCDPAPAVPAAPGPERAAPESPVSAEEPRPEPPSPEVTVDAEPGPTPADATTEGVASEGEGDRATETGGEARSSPMAGIEIDRERREVRVAARVALNAGILEFLVVAEGGRVHESVFSSPVRPSMLHLSLLMIGLEPCGPVGDDDKWYERARASSARLNVEVECEVDGQTMRAPVSELLYNREARDGVAPDTWVFAGSHFVSWDGKQQYAGDLQDAIVSIVPFGASVVQYATQTLNPYADEEFGLALEPHEIGPVGTPVTLVFSPWDGIGGEPAGR